MAALGIVAFWVVAHLRWMGPVETAAALLKFARGARNAAAVLGGALIVVGLVHYRSTKPRGEIHWVVLGMTVRLGSGVVHWWLARVER